MAVRSLASAFNAFSKVVRLQAGSAAASWICSCLPGDYGTLGQLLLEPLFSTDGVAAKRSLGRVGC